MVQSLFIVIHLLISFGLLTPRSAYAREVSSLSRIQSTNDSIVTIRAQTITLNRPTASISELTGAGVIIDANGMIVTNTHIIYGSNLIKIVFKDGSMHNAEVLYVSNQYDFSILKISPPSPLTPIKWADSSQCTLGQEIITIGHSSFLDQTISGGRINGIGTRSQDDGQIMPELIQLSINYYPGDSGVPVFDLNGNFLGLITSKRTSLQRAVFAIPADKIHLAYLKLVNAAERQ